MRAVQYHLDLYLRLEIPEWPTAEVRLVELDHDQCIVLCTH